MEKCTEEDIDNLKSILYDHLRKNYPTVRMSEAEATQRASKAAEAMYCDELTTNQAVSMMFRILLAGYPRDADRQSQSTHP